jgi:hypothetical protein
MTDYLVILTSVLALLGSLAKLMEPLVSEALTRNLLRRTDKKLKIVLESPDGTTKEFPFEMDQKASETQIRELIAKLSEVADEKPANASQK